MELWTLKKPVVIALHNINKAFRLRTLITIMALLHMLIINAMYNLHVP